MMFQKTRSKKKLDLFTRKNNINYNAVAFTTGGEDAPPTTKKVRKKKKEGGGLSPTVQKEMS